MSGDFEAKLAAEFGAAEDRVKQMQQQAESLTEALRERYARFDAIRARVRENILKPKLEALLRRLPGPVKPLSQSDKEGGEVRLILGHTEEAPASVTYLLSCSHDGSVKSVIYSDDLSIVPVFFEYDRASRIEMPLDGFDEAKVSSWLEERLVLFMRNYLRIRFEEAYHRENMVTDPVANIALAKVNAAAKREHGGRTFYFASEGAAKAFDENPERYAGAGKG